MSESTEDSTYIIPFKAEVNNDTLDLQNATITYKLTEKRGAGDVKISKTDSDSTVYTDTADIDSELSDILTTDFSLSDSEATDLSNGRFIVEITPSEMPSAGTYYHEIRAQWPSNDRTFSDVVEDFVVKRASTQ